MQAADGDRSEEAVLVRGLHVQTGGTKVIQRSQEELNAIPPPPDPANYFQLDMDQTVAIMCCGDHIIMTATLREIRGGRTAMVQLTYQPDHFVEIPRDAQGGPVDCTARIEGNASDE